MEEIARLNSFMDNLQIRRGQKDHNNAIIKNKGVTVAGEQVIEQIEKQRAGSITSIDTEIRKLKTELYLERINKSNKFSNRQHSKQNKHSVSGNSENQQQSARRSNQHKARINTKEAAILEKQRLDNIVAHIKTKPLGNLVTIDSQ